MRCAVSRRTGPLAGDVVVPGDKSISHRALMLGACAVGPTLVNGLLQSDDVLATLAAMRSIGAEIGPVDGGHCVSGPGIGAFRESDAVLDLGNSGTSARLLIGLLAACPFITFVTGDASLSRRPMQRVLTPLSRMGAEFVGRSGGRLPLAVLGRDDLVPISYELPVASAQVKSAILLAALNTAGTTTVIEPEPSRDHTERMLADLGADIKIEAHGQRGRAISLTSGVELAGKAIEVPGDPSSAAFLMVAASIVPESRLMLRRIGSNPLRTAATTVLRAMGADIREHELDPAGGEPVSDYEVRGSRLQGVDVPRELVPALIDEVPILAMAAACADGVTRMSGLSELRVKESDRVRAIATGLSACGVAVEEGEDWLRITGTGRPPRGGGAIEVALDHRIAMAFLMLGAVAQEPVRVDDISAAETSFPGFASVANGIGCRISVGEER